MWDRHVFSVCLEGFPHFSPLGVRPFHISRCPRLGVVGGVGSPIWSHVLSGLSLTYFPCVRNATWSRAVLLNTRSSDQPHQRTGTGNAKSQALAQKVVLVIFHFCFGFLSCLTDCTIKYRFSMFSVYIKKLKTNFRSKCVSLLN